MRPAEVVRGSLIVSFRICFLTLVETIGALDSRFYACVRFLNGAVPAALQGFDLIQAICHLFLGGGSPVARSPQFAETKEGGHRGAQRKNRDQKRERGDHQARPLNEGAAIASA